MKILAPKPASYRTRITEMLGIDFPVIQGGMIWCAGSRLAAAVSRAGGLGLIGAGSMEPDLLQHHIRKARTLADAPFGVNLPLTYRHVHDCIRIVLDEKVPVVVGSAGSPKTYTPLFKEAGMTVLHVTSTPRLAVKCRDAGVDAVVAEGFEAGGHNGRDEITTFCLVPQVVDAVDIPVVAAGGIADGRGMAAALVLGAEGVQVGTRFAASAESSASEAYKKAVAAAGPADTLLLLKKLVPTRMIANSFARKVMEAEAAGASAEELKRLLGDGRARAAIFEGDLGEGEIEAGQCSGLVEKILTAEEILFDMVAGCRTILPDPPPRRNPGRNSRP